MDATDQGFLRERSADLVLVVVTDHGWTDLLRDGNERLPREFDAERHLWSVQSSHHGALEISLPPKDAEAGGLLRARLSDNWFVIEGDKYGLPNGPVWLLPRLQRRAYGGAARIHGRPSLEETIVPLAEFSLQSHGTAFMLIIQGRLVKGESGRAHLSVTNLSSWPARDVAIEMPDL